MTTTPMISLPQVSTELERGTRELTLFNAHGLHARPAAEFVNCVLLFESRVTLHAKGKQYPADRILEILLAGLHCGDTFALEVEGPDAEQAAARIASLPMFRREQSDTRMRSRRQRREALIRRESCSL
jgi:phosphocarrier protein